MLKKRRPSARDLHISDYLQSLPVGVHTIVVQADDCRPILKSEGELVITGLPSGNRLTIHTA